MQTDNCSSGAILSMGNTCSGSGVGGSNRVVGPTSLTAPGSTCGAIRPTNLPTENRRWIRHRKSLHLASPHITPTTVVVAHTKSSKIVAQSFPTPMEEPKKVLRAQYVGSAEVTQATGMDVLNAAIDQLVEITPVERYEQVNVSIAPSMISINQVRMTVLLL